MKTLQNLGLAAILAGSTLVGCAGNRVICDKSQDKISELASMVKKTAVKDDESQFVTMYSLTKAPRIKSDGSNGCVYVNASLYQTKSPFYSDHEERLVFEVYGEPSVLEENKRNDCFELALGKKYEFTKDEGEQNWKIHGDTDNSLCTSLDFVLREMSTSSKDNPLLKSSDEAIKCFNERIKLAESKSQSKGK